MNISSKKLFLFTCLLIPGSMFGMLRKMNRLRKTSRLSRSFRRLTKPSTDLQKSMQRFLATRRGARKNNQVTKSMVPVLMQKRLVKSDENDKKESFVGSLAVGTLLMGGGFIGVCMICNGIGIMGTAGSIPEFFVGAAVVGFPVSIIYHFDKKP